MVRHGVIVVLRSPARSAFMWLISPFVEESWLATGAAPASSRQDRLGQLLAQLDPPLVERVDVPEHTLSEDFVLIERDQPAERGRIEPAVEDRVARPVAREHLVRQQRLERRAGQPLALELGARLVGGLAERQRLGLGEEVGEQLVVVVAERRQALARRRGSPPGSARCPGGSAGRRRAGRWCRARPR